MVASSRVILSDHAVENSIESRFGYTLGNMLKDEFERKRRADPLHYNRPGRWTQQQLAQIRGRTMANILNDNWENLNAQDNPFILSTATNNVIKMQCPPPPTPSRRRNADEQFMNLQEMLEKSGLSKEEFYEAARNALHPDL